MGEIKLGEWKSPEICKDCCYQQDKQSATPICGYLLVAGKRRPTSAQEVVEGRCDVFKKDFGARYYGQPVW